MHRLWCGQPFPGASQYGMLSHMLTEAEELLFSNDRRLHTPVSNVKTPTSHSAVYTVESFVLAILADMK